MATPFQLIRGALHEVGLDQEATSRRARELLDDTTYNETIAFCLSQAEWNFALRDAQVASSATPAFGYTYSIAKPADWVRTAVISSFAGFVPPLGDYVDQVAKWLTNVTPVYLKYVSNDTAYGLSLTIWPSCFTKYVELELAWRCAGRVTLSETDKEKLLIRLDAARTAALVNDVMVVV